MTEDECRSADWFRIGDRDARYYGIQPQIDQYAAQCARHGLRADPEPYMAGWRTGYSESQGRMGSGGGGGGGSM